MGNTLISVSEYFKGKDVPKVHPFQDVKKENSYTKKNNKSLDREGEQPFGYEKDKHIKTNKSHKSLKANN